MARDGTPAWRLQLALLGALCARCAPATEVLLTIDTDVPASLPLALTARLSRGNGPSAHPSLRSWQRSPSNDAGLALPASFAAVPGDGPEDGPVFLELEAAVEGVALRRRATFHFVPRRAMHLALFLSTRCLAPTAGCAAEPCTLLRRCEERGLTCGSEGDCIPVESALRGEPGAGASRDATPCGAYGDPCCYVGDLCAAPLSCVAGRCQRCVDPQEACCAGPELRAEGSACAGGLCHAGACEALATPAGLTATSPSQGTLQVRWNAVAGAASYDLEAATENAFATPSSTTAGTATSTLRGLVAGQRYYLRVRAVASGATTPWSATAQAVTAVDPPAAPGVTVSIPGLARSVSACCWVVPPGSGSTWYYAQGTASASCPAGTSTQYRFAGQYTSDPSPSAWTGWMGPDGFMVGPRAGYGVRFLAQARCVGPDASSSESGTGSACRLNGGGGC